MSRHIGRCATTGKAQFASRQDAKKMVRVYGGGKHVFRCEACGFLHVGGTGGYSREQHRQWAREKAARGAGEGE